MRGPCRVDGLSHVAVVWFGGNALSQPAFKVVHLAAGGLLSRGNKKAKKKDPLCKDWILLKSVFG